MDIFFSITTETEYLSLKHLKFERVSITTLNRHYRQLMIALIKLNEAGEMGEQWIRSFSKEYIGWQDPTKLTKPTPPQLSQHAKVVDKSTNSYQVKTEEHRNGGAHQAQAQHRPT